MLLLYSRIFYKMCLTQKAGILWGYMREPLPRERRHCDVTFCCQPLNWLCHIQKCIDQYFNGWFLSKLCVLYVIKKQVNDVVHALARKSAWIAFTPQWWRVKYTCWMIPADFKLCQRCGEPSKVQVDTFYGLFRQFYCLFRQFYKLFTDCLFNLLCRIVHFHSEKIYDLFIQNMT